MKTACLKVYKMCAGMLTFIKMFGPRIKQVIDVSETLSTLSIEHPKSLEIYKFLWIAYECPTIKSDRLFSLNSSNCSRKTVQHISVQITRNLSHFVGKPCWIHRSFKVFLFLREVNWSTATFDSFHLSCHVLLPLIIL